MPQTRNGEAPRFWNLWWTLAVLAAAFTILVAILEALGYFQDLGIVLGFVGVVMTTLFGMGGTTRFAVRSLHQDIQRVRADLQPLQPALDMMAETLREIRRILDERLPASR